jgi:hypothetical protein
VNNPSKRQISAPLASFLPSGDGDYGNHVTPLTQAKNDTHPDPIQEPVVVSEFDAQLTAVIS